MRSVVVILLLLNMAIAVQANELGLESYPGARVIYQTTEKTDDYTLALSSYKKIAGNWLIDRSQRLKGQLYKFTVELPVGHSLQNGFDFYVDQLNTHSIRELFYCSARDCGTSNSWANNHFKVQQLYGLDQYQQYAAYEVMSSNGKPVYVSLYAVRRGNKRVYLQVETLSVYQVLDLGVASSLESIIKALTNSGYYVFPDLIADDAQGNSSVQIKPAHVNVLVDVLTQKKEWSLALVGHDYAQPTLSQQQSVSMGYAEQIKVALVEKGIDKLRIKVYGVGGLAPAGRGGRVARVEIVKIENE
jgi:hypothetical protein